MTEDQLNELPALSAAKDQENKRFFKKLKKRPPKDLDTIMHALDEAAFERINCLDCANCCKTTGPLFTDADIRRVAKALRLKPQQFMEAYLQNDEDGDRVLKQLPCPFLGGDNYCTIYPHRPKACREYPHTRQRKFQNHASLHLKNIAICPAAYTVVESLKEKLDF